MNNDDSNIGLASLEEQALRKNFDLIMRSLKESALRGARTTENDLGVAVSTDREARSNPEATLKAHLEALDDFRDACCGVNELGDGAD